MERLSVHSIVDIVYRLRRGQSVRAICRDLGHSRGTVRRYRELAKRRGYLDPSRPLPEPGEVLAQLEPALSAPGSNVSGVEPYREVVAGLLEQGVEMVAIHQRLGRHHGYQGSYSSVRRFVRRLRPRHKEVVVRIETPPGQQAQVDFGGAGKMRDPATGRLRQAWCFVMTLSYSRHQYVEFVFDQRMETWIGCHRRAFESFGGVPKELVVDNLKAAVLRAALDDPRLAEPYRKLAQHYGTLVHPCRPGMPQHKGKAENGVHYVQRNLLAGEGELDLTQANRLAKSWVLEVAGVRDHGTTHVPPLRRFREEEQAALLPLPEEPFSLREVRSVTLHRDCHVQVEGSYYSAPFAYVGQRLDAYLYQHTVQLYDGVTLLVTHPRDSPRPADDQAGALPRGEVLLSDPHPGVLPSAGGADWAPLWAGGQAALGGAAPGSAAQCPGAAGAGAAPLAGAAGGGLCPGPALRRCQLPSPQAHPGSGPGPGAPGAGVGSAPVAPLRVRPAHERVLRRGGGTC